MAHNPECGLDCVSAGAVRRPSADANQSAERQYLSGDQSAEQVSFTPGPWLPGSPLAERRFIKQVRQTERGRETRFVAEVVHALPHIDGEMEANAWLIAAAPCLLEELKNLLAICRHRASNHDLAIARAEAAIARAEGRDR